MAAPWESLEREDSLEEGEIREISPAIPNNEVKSAQKKLVFKLGFKAALPTPPAPAPSPAVNDGPYSAAAKMELQELMGDDWDLDLDCEYPPPAENLNSGLQMQREPRPHVWGGTGTSTEIALRMNHDGPMVDAPPHVFPAQPPKMSWGYSGVAPLQPFRPESGLHDAMVDVSDEDEDAYSDYCPMDESEAVRLYDSEEEEEEEWYEEEYEHEEGEISFGTEWVEGNTPIQGVDPALSDDEQDSGNSKAVYEDALQLDEAMIASFAQLQMRDEPAPELEEEEEERILHSNIGSEVSISQDQDALNAAHDIDVTAPSTAAAATVDNILQTPTRSEHAVLGSSETPCSESAVKESEHAEDKKENVDPAAAKEEGPTSAAAMKQLCGLFDASDAQLDEVCETLVVATKVLDIARSSKRPLAASDEAVWERIAKQKLEPAPAVTGARARLAPAAVAKRVSISKRRSMRCLVKHVAVKERLYPLAKLPSLQWLLDQPAPELDEAEEESKKEPQISGSEEGAGHVALPEEVSLAVSEAQGVARQQLERSEELTMAPVAPLVETHEIAIAAANTDTPRVPTATAPEVVADVDESLANVAAEHNDETEDDAHTAIALPQSSADIDPAPTQPVTEAPMDESTEVIGAEVDVEDIPTAGDATVEETAPEGVAELTAAVTTPAALLESLQAVESAPQPAQELLPVEELPRVVGEDEVQAEAEDAAEERPVAQLPSPAAVPVTAQHDQVAPVRVRISYGFKGILSDRSNGSGRAAGPRGGTAPVVRIEAAGPGLAAVMDAAQRSGAGAQIGTSSLLPASTLRREQKKSKGGFGCLFSNFGAVVKRLL